MTVLRVVKMGHPVLRTVAEKVSLPAAEEVRTLITDMTETLAGEKGAGLAAPQVGIPLRIVVAHLGESVFALVNPELTPAGEEQELGWEGCLSLPGLRGVVPRSAKISWRAFDADGTPLSGEAEGFEARMLQHEVDHLDGILYLDRMPDLRLLTYLDEIHHFMPEESESGDTENTEGENHE